MQPDSIASHSRPRPSSFFSLASLSALLLLLPSCTTAFDCDNILAQGVQFHLKPLAGPQKVHWLDEEYRNDGRLSNYTFTLDICKVLEWDKGTDKQTNCQLGSQVCGIREDIDLSETHNNTITPITIAGNYGRGREIDEKFELFRNSKSNADSGREGFRAELHGGLFAARKQQAIIEFVCDRNRTGLEGAEKDGGNKDENKDGKNGDKDGDKGAKGEGLRMWDDDGCENNDNSLRFCKYDRESEVQTLRLQWRTEYACEDRKAPGSDSNGWGFFTWLFVIVFLATASYLIFGSWLNYNRYGARGWDLLPHGDTIRDVPYILKDWGRRVTSTVQGPGSRGGYSAV